MIIYDPAHEAPLDVSHKLLVPATNRVVTNSLIPESAFQLNWINADGVVGAEGQLYSVLGIDKIQSLKGRPNLSLFYAPLNFSRLIRPGEKKAIRVWCGGGGDHSDNAFILRRFVSEGNRPQIKYGDAVDVWGWQWMYFNYAANGYLRWTVTGASDGYAGYPGGPVTFDCVTRRAYQQFQLDVGRDGSSPPAGWAWV